MYHKACVAAGSVRGEKSAFIVHLIGNRVKAACPHASDEAKATATEQRDAKVTAGEPAAGKKHSRSQSAATQAAESSSGPHTKKLRQAILKTYKGNDIPFSKEQTEAIKAQALRAVISANLPFCALENPEMLTLFWMMRTAAPEIIPSAKVIGGRLLAAAAKTAEVAVKAVMKDAEVGLS